jgi:hypothetical protein
MKTLSFTIFYLCALSCAAQVDTTSNGLLNKAPVRLNEVVVESHRLISKADKFIMRVPVNENKNGEELLRQAPSVVFNGSDITINGVSGTKVFVNDREIRLQGDNLINYVRSLSSKDIDRIEVQTMAGAGDDADARGGIIHIKLRHKLSDDYQGNVALKGMASNKSMTMHPSASFSVHQGKWDFYTFGSGSWTPNDKGYISSTRIYHNDINKFSSWGEIKKPAHDMNLSAGAFYEIDSMRTIGAEIGFFHDYTDMETNSSSSLTYSTYVYNSIADYSQKMKFNMYSGSVNYQRKLDDKGSMLKLMADYARKESTNNDLYDIHWLWNNRDTTYRSHLSSTYDIASADLSYKKAYAAGTAIQTGIKFTTTQMNNDNNYQSLLKNTWNEVPAYRYSYQYNEYIYAGYAEINTDVNKWQIAAGIRAEKTKTVNHNADINKNYLNLYPHLSLGYAFDEMKRWMISLRYARQIERPAFDALNPNRIQLSQYSYQIGNPNLKPSYINRLSATLIHDYRYTLTVGCDLHTDLIREFAKQDSEDKDVSYVTYENHHHENHWFVNINAPFEFCKAFDLTTNFTAVRQCIQMTEGDNYTNHNLIFINFTAHLNLPRQYSIELEYNMHNRLYSGNSSIESSNKLNLKAKKSLNKDKILLTAGIDNILNESSRYQCQLDEYLLKTRNKIGTTGRLVSLSLTYNFSAGNKVKQQRVENSSSEDRLRMSKAQ